MRSVAPPECRRRNVHSRQAPLRPLQGEGACAAIHRATRRFRVGVLVLAVAGIACCRLPDDATVALMFRRERGELIALSLAMRQANITDVDRSRGVLRCLPLGRCGRHDPKFLTPMEHAGIMTAGVSPDYDNYDIAACGWVTSGRYVFLVHCHKPKACEATILKPAANKTIKVLDARWFEIREAT